MKRFHKTAMGKSIDMDRLRLTNEETIAVGNMKVNARGDELGPGGQIVKTKAEVMKEYYSINAPMVDTSMPPVPDEASFYNKSQATQAALPKQMRGNLADNVLKNNPKILDDQDGEK